MQSSYLCELLMLKIDKEVYEIRNYEENSVIIIFLYYC